ncbi:hypothetical protein DAMDJJ_20530 [Cupriavidus necator]|uniref:hypothetical protein n=1 Tax=Cupriavidus necator TaxID=106590 RepID=UPI003F73E5CA
MPTTDEIEAIANSIGNQYGVDVDKARADAKNLFDVIQSGGKQVLSDGTPYANTVTCGGLQAAIIPDIETFERKEIILEPRLFVSRVEQNLDEAVRYTEICLQLRRQYGELAKLRNDTRFKFEEFFRLDLVHGQEMKAGLYELPSTQADAEQVAIDEGIKTANAQIAAIDSMYIEGPSAESSGVLSDKAERLFAENSGQIARATANTKQDQIEGWNKEITRRRLALDQASWTQSRLAAVGSRAQQNARLDAAKAKADYLKKDVGFRTHRAEISRQLAWLQLHEHRRDDSVLNYNKRLSALRDLFDANLRLLVQRALCLRDGLSSYYGMLLPDFIAKRGEILDEIALWLVRAQDRLSKYRRAQRIEIWSKTSEGLIILKPNPSNTGDSFDVEFDFSAVAPMGGHMLLRGVAFELMGNYNGPVTLTLDAPPDATPFSVSPVRFGRVGAFSPGLELKPQHTELFWNGSPNGIWKVSGVLGRGNGNINGVIIHIWVSIS